MKRLLLLLATPLFILSCGLPSNSPVIDTVVTKDLVAAETLPMDTAGAGPVLSAKEDSALIMNAPENFIVKRIEKWRYDEKSLGKDVRQLEMSQTFYGGGKRIDSVFLTYSGNGRLSDVNIYDAKGLETEENEILSGGNTIRTINKYDKQGHLVNVSYFRVSDGQKPEPYSSLSNKMYENAYNEKSLLTGYKEYALPSKRLEEEMEYTYDAAGNRVSEKGFAAYENGDTTKYDSRYEYDSKNRLVKENDLGGFIPGELSFEYNDQGQKVREFNSSVSRSFYFDKAGNVILEKETSFRDGASKDAFLKYKRIYYKR